jgi:predicted transglutaminase-like cysteine proteinase
MKSISFHAILFFITLSLGSILFVREAESQSLNTQGLFGSVEFKVGSIDALKKWKDVLGKIKKEQEVFKACDHDLQNCQNDALRAWRKFVDEAKFKSKQDILNDVNNFINNWPYIEDSENWNRTDYWASPLEFLDKSGDCEDYAILKYITLKELGFNTHTMRIAVVRDQFRRIDHAVLVVYENNRQPVVLDSLFDVILPHDKVLQYTPHYSVNEHARWAHVMPIK